jgi:hypothetical protein
MLPGSTGNRNLLLTLPPHIRLKSSKSPRSRKCPGLPQVQVQKFECTVVMKLPCSFAGGAVQLGRHFCYGSNLSSGRKISSSKLETGRLKLMSEMHFRRKTK